MSKINTKTKSSEVESHYGNPDVERHKDVTGTDVGVKRGIDVTEIDTTLRTDSSSVAGTTYVGTAEVGAATSSAVWQIFRVVESGSDITLDYADGNADFDNIWDNRTGLSYS